MIDLLCVGLGGMGHHDWNAAIDCGGFRAVAGVDVDAGARAKFTEKTGAPTFVDFDEAAYLSYLGENLLAIPTGLPWQSLALPAVALRQSPIVQM